MYCGFVTTIKELRKHSNADRLQICTVFGNDVIVDNKYTIGQRIIYFPSDGQLSEEFCVLHNLVRKKDESGNNIGGYLDPDKRNIRAIKIRGEKSDGLIMPLESLSSFVDITTLKDGDRITELNGHEICKKYIPNRCSFNRGDRVSKTRNANISIRHKYPLFAEHVDTEQLAYNKDAFKPGDICYITLKLNGTSARTANTIEVENKKPNLLQRIFHIPGKQIKHYSVISGTRRTVLDTYDGGYHGSNAFRKPYHDFFAKVLPKGVEIFYEIVGWVDDNITIMGRCKNSLVKDKEFQKRYGDETIFSYGCDVGKNDCYVYRMTMTNEDGFKVEIPWEKVKIECDKMGVKYAPEFEKFIFTTWEDLMERVEKYYDGADPIDPSHIREGVVVRIENRSSFTAYKHKNHDYKCLEGIIKDTSDAPDIEEQEELLATEA